MFRIHWLLSCVCARLTSSPRASSHYLWTYLQILRRDTKLWWVNITPFDSPVVPLEYGRKRTSSLKSTWILRGNAAIWMNGRCSNASCYPFTLGTVMIYLPDPSSPANRSANDSTPFNLPIVKIFCSRNCEFNRSWLRLIIDEQFLSINLTALDGF